MIEPHDTASDVFAEEGHVIVDGPGHIAYTMTPAAALDAADKLFAVATEAHGQRVIAERVATRVGRPST